MFTIRSRRGTISLGIACLALAAFAVLASFNPAESLATDGQRTGSLGTWQFQYTAPQPDEDGYYFLSYDYARSSKAEVEDAVAAMNSAARDLARTGTPFQATLVFDRPLPIESFITFARKNGLTPTNNVVRAFDPDKGGVIKMTAPPEFERDSNGRVVVGKPKRGGNPFDTEGFAEFTRGHKSLRVQGVISTDVTLDQTTYEKLQSEPRLYAIDVMQHTLRAQFLKEKPDVAPEKLQIQWSILYPAMEEVGIAPDPKRQ